MSKVKDRLIIMCIAYTKIEITHGRHSILTIVRLEGRQIRLIAKVFTLRTHVVECAVCNVLNVRLCIDKLLIEFKKQLLMSFDKQSSKLGKENFVSRNSSIICLGSYLFAPKIGKIFKLIFEYIKFWTKNRYFGQLRTKKTSKVSLFFL